MARDHIKQNLRGRALDQIVADTKESRSSLIVQSLKREKRTYSLSNDLDRSIVYRIKEEYRSRREPVLDVNDIDWQYNVIVNDNSIQNPFVISPSLVQIIRRHTNKYASPEEKARAIFDWIQDNIEYGKSKRINGYKNSKETLDDREGVCGEMAFVYITMARSCGLKSAYATVTLDYEGKQVSHGCAIVDLGDRDILVDPAYHTFDIRHRRYAVLTDGQILEIFNQWRRAEA